MSWEHHHSASEILASAAEALKRLGEAQRARDLYKSAAEEEMLALDQVDKTKARTLGVTAVSATALFYKAGDHQAAKNLANQFLNQSSIPLFAREQLGEILELLDGELIDATTTNRFLKTLTPFRTDAWRRWMTASVAILYSFIPAWAVASTINIRRTTGLDIGWNASENYRFVITLCLIIAAIAFSLLRSKANWVAVFSFAGVIVCFYRWSAFTNAVKANTGLSFIPDSSGIGNQFIGAGLFDLMVLVTSIALFGLSVVLLVKGNSNKPQAVP